MTSQMQNFLNELAILLEKHKADIEATESAKGYSCYCDGIEFGIQTDERYDVVKVSKFPDADELRKCANAK